MKKHKFILVLLIFILSFLQAEFHFMPAFGTLSMVEELTGVPDIVFQNIENNGYTGDQDFTATMDGKVYRCFAAPTSEPVYSRRFEIKEESSGNKLLQCTWDATKKKIKMVAKPAVFMPADAVSSPNPAVVLKVEIDKSGDPERGTVTMQENMDMKITLDKYSDGTYDLSSTLVFPSDFLNDTFQNRSILIKSKVTALGNAKFHFYILPHDSTTPPTIIGGDSVNPSGFSDIPPSTNPLYMSAVHDAWTPALLTLPERSEINDNYLDFLDLSVGLPLIDPVTIKSEASAILFENWD